MLGFLRAILCPTAPCLWLSQGSSLNLRFLLCSWALLSSVCLVLLLCPGVFLSTPGLGTPCSPLLSIFYPSCLPLWFLSVFSAFFFPASSFFPVLLRPNAPPLTSHSPEVQDGCLGPTTQTLQASAPTPQSSSQPSWSVKSRQHMPNIFLSASSSPVFPKFLPESTSNGEQARPRQSPLCPLPGPSCLGT